MKLNGLKLTLTEFNDYFMKEKGEDRFLLRFKGQFEQMKSLRVSSSSGGSGGLPTSSQWGASLKKGDTLVCQPRRRSVQQGDSSNSTQTQAHPTHRLSLAPTQPPTQLPVGGKGEGTVPVGGKGEGRVVGGMVVEQKWAEPWERWPLLIDPMGKAPLFLRHCDTNYVDIIDVRSMQPDMLRLAVIGAFRFPSLFHYFSDI